jgi:hypothetical protein
VPQKIKWPDRQTLRQDETLSQLTKQELRKEEILLTKQRDRLFKRIEQISTDKQKIFQTGATQKSRSFARRWRRTSSSRRRSSSWPRAS